MAQFCQFEKFKEIKSSLTGNTIYANSDANLFLIRQKRFWDLSILHRTLRDLRDSKPWTDPKHSSSMFRKTVFHLLEELNEDVLVRTINSLMDERQNWGVIQRVTPGEAAEARAAARPWAPRDKTRIAELLAAFWQAGALAFPNASIPAFERVRFNIECDWRNALIKRIVDTGLSHTYAVTAASNLQYVLLKCCPVRCAGDVVPDLLKELPAKDNPYIRMAFRALAFVLQAIYNNRAPSAKDYWPKTPPLQDDLEFKWAVASDTEMSAWANLAARWYKNQKTSLENKHQSLRLFLQKILDRPHLPREPRSLLTRTNDPDQDFGADDINAYRTSILVDFLDWVIDTEFSARRSDGTLERYTGIYNPLTKKANQRLTETNKNVMPPWILSMLQECLVEDEWSWAKKAVGDPNDTSKGDWYYEIGENGGLWKWCPARAVSLYVKLTFPSRQGQTRHLDSGEADAKIAVFDQSACEERAWHMVPNPHRIPSALSLINLTREEQQKLHDRALGAVQVATAPKRNYLRLRFPTNKTADIGKEPWSRGYTSPWMPERLAYKLLEMREWQTTNNPITKTTLWEDVDEFKRGRGRKHPELLRGMDSAFLFRDATSNRPDQPISDAKVHNLYSALCQEVQRRCAEIGLTGPDGQPIQLIASYDQTGQPSGLVYPLHSLRVSIVTHYIETGGVSPEVMMKIVGHATVAMVIYYTKQNGEYIADVMARADDRISEKARHKWISEARDKELEALRRMAFGTSDVAYNRFHSAPPNGLLPVDVGVCTTAGGGCNEGGSRLSMRTSEDLYAPVPGGRSNCAGCRFLVSGEPWQEGIVSEFNVRSLDLSLKNRHLDRLDEQFLPLDDERAACMRDSRTFLEQDEWRALMREKEEIEAAQEQLHTEMANLMMLEQQIRRIAQNRAKAGETRMALVVGDVASVETALQESTEFDLVDRICRSVDVYPSLVARGTTVATATLFRARAWDRVLRQQGLEPRFLDLSPDEGRLVGNRLTEWLDMRIGRPGTLALMDGKETIEEICRRTRFLPENVLREMQEKLDTLAPVRFVPRSLKPHLAGSAHAMLGNGR